MLYTKNHLLFVDTEPLWTSTLRSGRDRNFPVGAAS
jgi:hypothetical protein